MADPSSSVRYTVRLWLWPSERTVDYPVVTRYGELKAAVMAALRQARLDPDSRIARVEVVRVEHEFTIDPANDLLSYWEEEP